VSFAVHNLRRESVRAALICVALTAAASLSYAQGIVPPDGRTVLGVLQVRGDDLRSLQDSLLALAADRLRPSGLSIDRARARLSLSAALPAVQTFEVLSAGSQEADPPSLPLRFELRPLAGSAVSLPIQVTLAVALQRDVPVAVRHLSKGSDVTCADITLDRRDIRQSPRLSLPLPCDIPAGTVALHDISRNDVVRSLDIGKVPDVSARTPVHITASAGGVSVTASAIALSDGRVGDRIEVRMQRPARTLRARVIGAGAVQLEGF
jgi:flagella basal body P-ring formation protein FlgA